MRGLLITAVGVLTVIMFASPLLVIPARAQTEWVGNDDGEFGTMGVNPNAAGASVVLTQTLSWSSSPPDGTVSFQLNPDASASFWEQTNNDWFQAVIGGEQGDGGWAQFAIQVYSYNGNGYGGMCTIYCPSIPFSNVPGMFEAGASWVIEEFTNSSNSRIESVWFSVQGAGLGAGNLSYTWQTPQDWKWLKSNVCLCGADDGAATFSSAGGAIFMDSTSNLYTIAPPSWIGTLEDSNVYYGCVFGNGTTGVDQAFGITGTPGLCDPTIGTTLYSNSINTGDSVYDAASLSGYNLSAGGTVTYYYSTTDSCPTSGATDVGSVTVTDGLVPPSPYHTFEDAGTYYWYAAYSGDSLDNPATSPCEQLTVSSSGGGGSTCAIGLKPSVTDLGALDSEASYLTTLISQILSPMCLHCNPC